MNINNDVQPPFNGIDVGDIQLPFNAMNVAEHLNPQLIARRRAAKIAELATGLLIASFLGIILGSGVGFGTSSKVIATVMFSIGGATMLASLIAGIYAFVVLRRNQQLG